MPVLKLKNTGTIKLGGRIPGEVFTLKCDENGAPLDIYWRRRLSDEARYGGGHLTVVLDAPPAPIAPLPEPVVAPEPVVPVPESEPAADAAPAPPAPAPKPSKKGN